MNPDALIFMLSAWGFTLGLLVFCIVKLVNNPQESSLSKDESDT